MLTRMLNQMVEQEARKQEIIKFTNGAVLQPNLPLNKADSSTSNPQLDYIGYYWLSDTNRHSDPMYENNDPNQRCVGYVYDWTKVASYPDDDFAELYTAGWNLVDTQYGGGEALVNGPLDGTCQSGNVYIQAKVGPYWEPYYDLYDEDGWYMWNNYVIVYCSEGPVGMGEADYVGYVSVQAESKTQYYVGTGGYYGPFNWLYVFCWTPPYLPSNYYPHIYNSVYIDTAFVWGSNP